jgi:glycosyltransferase involved in cell wall biosynthesis
VAASYATGDFIYFMDADDWVDRDMLETMYHKAVSENADMVICTFDIVTSNGIEKYDFTLFESNEEWLDYLITRNRKCHTTAGLHTRVFSRDLYQKVKNLCDFTGLIRYEDFLLVIALHYYSSHVFVLQKSFYHYNKVNENSITKVQNDYTVLCIIRAGDYLQKFLEGVQLYEHYKGSVGKFRANGYNQYLLKWELWDPKKWAYWHDKYSNDSKPEGFTLKYRTFLSLIRILVACRMEGVAKKLVRLYGLK